MDGPQHWFEGSNWRQAPATHARMRRQRSKELNHQGDSSSGDENNEQFTPEEVSRGRPNRHVQTMNDINKPKHPNSPLENLDQAVTNLHNYLSGSEGDVDTDNPLSPLRMQERTWNRHGESVSSSASSLSYTDEDGRRVVEQDDVTQHEYIDPSTVERKSPLSLQSPLNNPRLPPVLPPRNPGQCPALRPSNMVPNSDQKDISKPPLSPGHNENVIPTGYLPPAPRNMRSLNSHGTPDLDPDRPPYFPANTTVPVSPFSMPIRNNFRTGNQNRLSGGSYRFKKERKCTWKCAAIIFITACIVLLAVVSYLGAMLAMSHAQEEIHSEESGPTYHEDGGFKSVSGNSYDRDLSRPAPTRYIPVPTRNPTEIPVVFQVGNHLSPTIPPNGWLRTQFQLNDDTYVRFNFTISQDARLGIYGRRGMAPSHTQYDFVEIMNGAKMANRYKRAAEPKVSSAFVQYLDKSIWYLSVYNDRDKPEKITFMTARDDTMEGGCLNDCGGRGRCEQGTCKCFTGYTGADCSQSVCPLVCNGNGMYKEGRCQCHSSWKGLDCNIPADECFDPKCSGNGRCQDGKCICHRGFKGENCEEPDCSTPDCSGHGLCINGSCLCHHGYRGIDCSLVDTVTICKKECSNHGTYHKDLDICICDSHWTGPDCSEEKCSVDCGEHGRCHSGRCHCDDGWKGNICNLQLCDYRCASHGTCENGTCICHTGWHGKYCLLDGCPNGCNGHGACTKLEEKWQCNCHSNWDGDDCSIPLEHHCSDRVDNDGDGLTDCEDTECCSQSACLETVTCSTAADPDEVLLRRQPPSITASFYDRTKFLVEDGSVQSYAHQSVFNASRVAVIVGYVRNQHGSPVIGVRVSVAAEPLFGFTLTRQDGRFDLLVNGGAAITLNFMRVPYSSAEATIMVPWNQIVTLPPVELSQTNFASAGVISVRSNERCHVHDYSLMKPMVVSTWQSSHQGGCSEESAILTESQVLQESISLPGTRLNLVYHSSKMSGYMSTLLMKLTPEQMPKTLQLIHVNVEVEGVTFKTTLEAEPSLKFTYSWNRRNVYRQRVYGVVNAKVAIGYEYRDCDEIFWDLQTSSLSGYDIEISEIGGWNLDVHHRYNIREGILYKGDGTNTYLRNQPQSLYTYVGTGQRRPLDCTHCSGSVEDVTLMAAMALTSGPDGSLFIGDFNLIRRLTPEGQVFTVLELSADSQPYQYYLAIHPLTGDLYVSDPQQRIIMRVITLRSIMNVRDNYEIAVGSRIQCLPGDSDNCGDGGLAVNAKLTRPKGLAFDKDGNLYFADGMTIRMVNKTGHIVTLVGKHQYSGSWSRVPCSGPITFDEVQFQWPTQVSVSPLDDNIYVQDENSVFMLTPNGYVRIVVGIPMHCQTNDQFEMSLAEHVTLASVRAMAFSPSGDLYVAETDEQTVHQIRKVSTDGTISVFAGGRSRCDCRDPACICYNSGDTTAIGASFNTPAAITVTPDGTVHISDLGNLRIRSIRAMIPQVNRLGLYEVHHPEAHEVYVFNRFGQHIFTKNTVTEKTIYTFSYNVNSSYGKLSRITDSSQNKVSIYRDYSGVVNSIETSSGQRMEISLSHMGFLKSISYSRKEFMYLYEGITGLMKAKSVSEHQTSFFDYDDNGRLTQVIQPTGNNVVLTGDLETRGRVVRVAITGKPYGEIVTQPNRLQKSIGILRNTIITLNGKETAIKNRGNFDVTLESGNHPLLGNQYTVPVKQKVTVAHDLHNRIEWRYYLRREGRGEQKQVSQIGRRLKQNGDNVLTVEYNRETGNEAIYNKDQEKLLEISYNPAGQPTAFMPAIEGWSPVNMSYNTAGRLAEWRHGNVYEEYGYDRTGRLTHIKYSGMEQLSFSYGDNMQPTKLILPSRELYSMNYDQYGNLNQVTMPSKSIHLFQVLYSLGYIRKLYTAPQTYVPFIEDFGDNGRPLLTVYPSNQKRVVYRYNDQLKLSEIIYDNTVVKYDYDEVSGLVKSIHQMSQEFDAVTDFEHSGILVTEMKYRFGGRTLWTEVKFRYQYDSSFRITEIAVELEGRLLPPLTTTYRRDSGTPDIIGKFQVAHMGHSQTIITDGHIVISRQVDTNIREKMVTYKHKNLLLYASEYQYDSMDRVKEVKSVIGSNNEVTITKYVYNVDSMLVEVWINDGLVWKYTYDVNGNLIGIRQHEKQIGLAYNTKDQIQIAGETTYSTDADGFVIQRGTEKFQYNSHGQLIYATKTGTYDIWYYYDTQNRLTARRDHLGDTVQYFYADLVHPNRVSHFYNNSNSQVTVLFYNNFGRVFALQIDEVDYYVASDHMGTPQAIFSSSLNVVKEIVTSPYGQITQDTNPTFQLPLGFLGSIQDLTSQLVFIGGRPYDPMTGRWLTPHVDWDAISRDPQLANLYRFMKGNPVNEDKTSHYYLNDLKKWLSKFGYDMENLVKPSVLDISSMDNVVSNSLQLTTGLECSLRTFTNNIEQYNTVPESKVTEGFHVGIPEAKIASSSVFGDGVIVSVVDGRTIVNTLPNTEKQIKAFSTVLLNGTYPVGIHLTIQGMDSHFFVKEAGKQAAEDLWKLSLNGDYVSLENGVNVTVHKINVDSKSSNIDVRLQGHHSVINVRYGTSLADEHRRVVDYAKQWAISQAWARELNLLSNGYYGSYHWTQAEQKQIADTGSVAGYSGHYLRDVQSYPELVDDCNNIVFRKQLPLDNLIKVWY